MSATSSDKTPSSKQAKQIVLIAILSAGLLIAILTQPSDPSAESVDSVTSSSTIPVIATSVSPPPFQDTEAIRLFSATRSLPRVEVDQLEKTPLFRPSPKSPSSVAADETVRAVYGGVTGHRALVDREILTDGQSLGDGRTVIRVTSDGIQLSKNAP